MTFARFIEFLKNYFKNKPSRYFDLYGVGDFFIAFEEEFCKNITGTDSLKVYNKCRKRLYYYLRKAIENGYIIDHGWIGLGEGSLNMFGARRLKVYEYIDSQ